VAERRAFLLRIDPELYEVLQRWAGDELRSLNGQIEFVLRRAAADAGRLRTGGGADERGSPS
jgi:hypothetical protein